jgi:hypothetical protein
MRLAAIALALATALFGQQQPVPFSHKLHAGAIAMKCELCHPNPDPGETMTLPSPDVCGRCHKGQYDHEIAWVRVYRIPSFVDFSHREHLHAGNTCAECHGPVAQRDQLTKEADLTMGGCMECHRVKNASIGCNYCHQQRN